MIFFNGTRHLLVESMIFLNARLGIFNIPQKFTVFHPIFFNRALTFPNKSNFREKSLRIFGEIKLAMGFDISRKANHR